MEPPNNTGKKSVDDTLKMEMLSRIDAFEATATTFWENKFEEWKKEQQQTHVTFRERLDNLENSDKTNLNMMLGQCSAQHVQNSPLAAVASLNLSPFPEPRVAAFPANSTRNDDIETKEGSNKNSFPCVLQPFDGTGAWGDYEHQFNIASHCAGWSKPQKANALAMQLRGQALSVLSAMPSGRELDYDQLVSLLRQRFGLDEQTSYSHLRQRVQGLKESLTEFAITLKRLAIAAFPRCPNEVVDKILTTQFIDGIRDEAVQLLVVANRPANLSLRYATYLCVIYRTRTFMEKQP